MIADLSIDISELLRGEIGKKRNFSFTLPNEIARQILGKNAKFWGEITYLGEELMINFSTTEFTNQETCVRCLTECSQITSIDQALEGYSLANPTENSFNLLTKKGTDDSQTFLDLEPLLSQELQLSFRAHPLCREDCAGLCPECGNNRNLKQCQCESKPLPTPFDSLKSHFPSES